VETRAVARFVRVSPRKARLVTDLIRGKDLAEAQQILDFNEKAAARIVAKVLASAAANAENNNGLTPDSLYVIRAFVDEGPTLKRFRPRAMGRATRINKRTSHITVVLEEREPEKAAAKRKFRVRPRQVSKAKQRKAEEKAAAEREAEEERLEAEAAQAEELAAMADEEAIEEGELEAEALDEEALEQALDEFAEAEEDETEEDLEEEPGTEPGSPGEGESPAEPEAPDDDGKED